MGWVRSRWLLRCTALLLAGAMLPPVLAPSSRAASGSLSGSYAEWIRAQLRTPADAALEEALKEAAGSNAGSFASFVEALLEAYEGRHPRSSAAQAFVDEDLSKDALIAYLQRRYTELRGDAVRLGFRAVAASVAASCSTAFCGPRTVRPRCALSPAPWLQTAQEVNHDPAVRRPLSPARPQGP